MPARTTTLLASAARTAATTVDFNRPANAEDVTIVIEVTAITSTPVITFTLHAYEPGVSDDKYSVLYTFADVDATGDYSCAIGKNAVGRDKMFLPTSLFLDVAVADTDSATYSVVAIWS